MKFNIAYPAYATQKTIDVDDERKLRHFMDKRLSAEVDGEALGDQFRGYVFKIAGGFDKQGFSMKQGVLIPGRVKILMRAGTSCYKPRRDGERKRKSVRGCIVSSEISVLNLVIVKKGDEEIPGLTDKNIPRRLGPKRASKIRKLFDLGKKDDVRKYVIRRELPPKETKEGEAPKKTKGKRTKAPKIQRLVTPVVLQRKRHRLALKKKRTEKNKLEAANYAKLVAQRAKEARQSLLSKRRSQSVKKSESQKVEAKPAPTTAATGKAAAKVAAKVAAKTPAKTAAKTGAKAAPTKPAAKEEKKAAAKAAPKEKTAAKPAPSKEEKKAAAPKAAAKSAPVQPKQSAKPAKK